MDIRIEKTTNPKQKPADETKLGFGHIFTDHMFIMDYDAGQGWHDARIVPYGPIELMPSAMVLHYGQEIFEGMKAYRTPSGDIQFFRPEENFKRMNVSAERLVIPQINEKDALEALHKLVEIDKDWVPHIDGASLYIRPFIFAADPFLGVRPGEKYYFMIIMSPSGAYYSTGINPVNIYVETNYVRAVRGGMGFTKTGGNYAASLAGQDEAHKQNYSQVLWLDGVERKYIEEVGAMNMMFLIDGKLVTAPLHDTILPGITRRSVMTLAREMGIEVEERPISVDELIAAGENGKLTEAFGTGTAAVVSPVGELAYRDKHIMIGDKSVNNGIGELTMKLYNTLTGLQWGRIEDTHGWVTDIDKK